MLVVIVLSVEHCCRLTTVNGQRRCQRVLNVKFASGNKIYLSNLVL